MTAQERQFCDIFCCVVLVATPVALEFILTMFLVSTASTLDSIEVFSGFAVSPNTTLFALVFDEPFERAEFPL